MSFDSQLMSFGLTVSSCQVQQSWSDTYFTDWWAGRSQRRLVAHSTVKILMPKLFWCFWQRQWHYAFRSWVTGVFPSCMVLCRWIFWRIKSEGDICHQIMGVFPPCMVPCLPIFLLIKSDFTDWFAHKDDRRVAQPWNCAHSLVFAKSTTSHLLLWTACTNAMMTFLQWWWYAPRS